LASDDSASRGRIKASGERHQTVFANPAQVSIGHQIRQRWQCAQRLVITPGADPNHLTVGAMDLLAPQRHPSGEGVVQLGDRVERSRGQDMVADDVDLALNSKS
jgi:hypothetical protein